MQCHQLDHIQTICTSLQTDNHTNTSSLGNFLQAGCSSWELPEWWGAICLERDADLHMAQLMPLSLTVCCFSKIQIGSTFLIPAHLGSPRQRAVKWVCVCMLFLTPKQQCQSTEGSSVKYIMWCNCSLGTVNFLRLHRCGTPAHVALHVLCVILPRHNPQTKGQQRSTCTKHRF